MRKLGFILAGALALITSSALAQVNPGSSPLSIAKGGTAAATASAARTSLGLAIGVNVQAFSGNLAALAGLTAAADKCFYFTGSGTPTAATYDCGSFSRSVLVQSTAANWRSTIGVAIGSNVEAWDADLDCIAALSLTGLIKRTGAGTCSAGAVAINDLATGTQDTVIGYFGATTASATAVPNCTGALTYSTGTHTFGCNAGAGTGTVTSVQIAANPGIDATGTCTITTTGTCTLTPSSGTQIGSVLATYTANTILSTVMPADDTIPQNTEGTQIISQAYTPKVSTSKLRLDFQGTVAASASDNATCAIFNGEVVNAIAAAIITITGANVKIPIRVVVEYSPGSTSLQTITVRCGPATSTIALNGNPGGRLLGGVSLATLEIREVM